MITRIQALGFRCLRYVDQRLGAFHVLVGPNASGKTTFLDVVSFLGALVSRGVDEAIEERTNNFRDLVWGRTGNSFELAIEADIPKRFHSYLGDSPYKDIIRYEVKIAYNSQTNRVEIEQETVLIANRNGDEKKRVSPDLFPCEVFAPQTIMHSRKVSKYRKVVNKTLERNDNFYSEFKPPKGEGGWAPSFKLGPRKSALGNLPADQSKLQIAWWLRTLLTEGVQPFVLNSLLMRKASPPGKGRVFLTDGSNLPWVVETLLQTVPELSQAWIEHLRTALPDLKGIRVVERPDDKHKYLMLKYDEGLEIPSWMASDGTLRLLALTIPAYLRDLSGVYLIEEPENGIHPRAVETLYQSLRSVYGAQILLATHSPVILSLIEPKEVLCFAKTPMGETSIILGSEHPALRNWKGQQNLGVLFAAGVMG